MLRYSIIPSLIRTLTTIPSTTASTASHASQSIELAALGNSFREQRPSSAKLIFLMGGPGSGKGTLGDLLAKENDTQHVSVGQLLRNASQTDPSIAQVLNRGGIVPSTTSIGLLLHRLCENPTTDCWVVDGFPRNISNATEWAKVAPQPTAFVALDVGNEIMRGRLLSRKRDDDTPQIIDSRLREFWNNWTQLRKYYWDLGLMHNVDAHGDPDEVLERYLQTIPK